MDDDVDRKRARAARGDRAAGQAHRARSGRGRDRAAAAGAGQVVRSGYEEVRREVVREADRRDRACRRVVDGERERRSLPELHGGGVERLRDDWLGEQRAGRGQREDQRGQCRSVPAISNRPSGVGMHAFPFRELPSSQAREQPTGSALQRRCAGSQFGADPHFSLNANPEIITHASSAPAASR